MKTLLYLHNLGSHSAREKLNGINAQARMGGWNVQTVENQLDKRSLQDLLDFWHPSGCIVGSAGAAAYRRSWFKGIPVVALDRDPRGWEGCSSVDMDAESTARLATRELLLLNCASYVFVRWPGYAFWSKRREEGFRKYLALNGQTALSVACGNKLSDVKSIQKKIISSIDRLPRPVGIFAANDYLAAHVVSACLFAGLQIPWDVFIVGVDDDASVCESLQPSLSSINLDFFAAGRASVDLLDRLLSGERPCHVVIPPKNLVRRGSTRTFTLRNAMVLSATEMIRHRACDGLRACDVCKSFGCSRRMAEMQFRAATGHSILDEIQTIRTNHAKELLSNPKVLLDSVSTFCGYRSDPAFRRIFKAETGLTPGEWRQQAMR